MLKGLLFSETEQLMEHLGEKSRRAGVLAGWLYHDRFLVFVNCIAERPVRVTARRRLVWQTIWLGCVSSAALFEASLFGSMIRRCQPSRRVGEKFPADGIMIASDRKSNDTQNLACAKKTSLMS